MNTKNFDREKLSATILAVGLVLWSWKWWIIFLVWILIMAVSGLVKTVFQYRLFEYLF